MSLSAMPKPNVAFGEINDDVGQSKQNGDTTRVQSLAVGKARQGLERFASFKYCAPRRGATRRALT